MSAEDLAMNILKRAQTSTKASSTKAPSPKTSAPKPAAAAGQPASLMPVIKVAVLTGAVVYLAGSVIAPRYTGETVVALSALSAKTGAPTKLAPEALDKQARAAGSAEIAGQIARQLKLAETPEFNRALGHPDLWSRLTSLAGGVAPAASEKDAVRAAVQSQIEVAAVPEASQLAIRFRATDAGVAAEGANAIAAAYAKSLAAAAAKSAPAAAEIAPAAQPAAAAEAPAAVDSSRAALVERQKQLSARIAAAAAEILAFESEEARLKSEPQPQQPKPVAAADPRLGGLAAELEKAKALRLDAEAQLKVAKEAVKSGNVDALVDAQRSPSLQTILQERVKLERQITELSASLLPDHPRMQQLNTKLAGLKREIAASLGKATEKLERDAKAAAAREAAVRRSIDDLAGQPAAAPAPQNDAKLRQVQAGLADRRAALDRMKTESAEVEASLAALPQPAPGVTAAKPAPAAQAAAPAASGPSIEATVVSLAKADQLVPVPNKLRLALIAAMIAAIAGFALRFLRPSAGRTNAELAVAANDAADAEVLEEATETVVARPAARRNAGPAKVAAAAAADAAPAEPETAGQTVADPEAGCDASRLDEIAAEILARPEQGIGIRTLITGADSSVQPAAEAFGLARRLAASGKAVVLVDWSTEGRGLASALSIRPEPGVNEILTGQAGFEDAVQCLVEVDGNELHVIAAGADLTGKADALDPDLINLVLDALDEAYDHIVVAGRHDEASDLFEAILGRFDAGVVVGEAGAPVLLTPGTFLGFEVTDIAVLDCTRPKPMPAAAPAAVATAKKAATTKAAALKAAAAKGGAKPEEAVPPVSQAAIARALRSGSRSSAA